MRKLIRALAWVVGVVVVLGAVARLLFMNAWTVPDDPHIAVSLAPTLRAGDTILFMTRGKGGMGDLVRCKDPEDPAKFVVGRIVGLPLDKVETDGIELVVNGKHYNSQAACPESLDTRVENPTTHASVVLRCDEVEIGGGWHYRGYISQETRSERKTVDVGAGRVFLLSDNRSYFDDSRSFGTVPLSSCSGRIFFRVWGQGGWGDDKNRLTYIH